MSLPRQIIPGTSYMITRRCTQRQFLLAPSPRVCEVFLYCLAVAAERTGVQVHALTVMSNHYHIIVTDPVGRLPEFYGWLHPFVAKALNAHRGRWENFWASEPTSCVRLATPQDVLAKTVYALANPVAAGLVARGDDWPGLRIYTPGRRRIKRPSGFFRSDGPMPEEVTLSVTLPPIGATNAHDALERVDAAVERCEAEVRATFRAESRAFLGVAAVRAQQPTAAPTTQEPRRELSPRVACRYQWLRIDILGRAKQFLVAYREALRRWREKRDIAFPFGTYQMVHRHAVAVAPS